MLFLIINFLKQFFQEYHDVSNSWDPDQAQLFVGPELGANCSQK